ncbi:MAG: hypothetical protein HQ445_02590 [Polaromonas sp.]|nr:hypothetical protein [Polaromonas sp.]
MATALSVGTKVGSVAGKLGAFAWSTTCRVASATGELGEGFIAGADAGWDAQMVIEEQKVAAAQVKKDAVRAAMLARREAAAPLGLAPAVDMVALAALLAAHQAKAPKAKA